MAESITVARPYTKAAFETALAQGDLGTWSELLHLAAAFVADADMSAMLENPALTQDRKADLVIDVCSASLALSDQAKNFVRLLAENKRLTLLPDISALFETLKRNQEKSIEVSITSAFELADDQQQKLAQALSTKLSREVTVNATTDASLIGGVIIYADDLVVDGSVRGKLGKLAEALSA